MSRLAFTSTSYSVLCGPIAELRRLPCVNILHTDGRCSDEWVSGGSEQGNQCRGTTISERRCLHARRQFLVTSDVAAPPCSQRKQSGRKDQGGGIRQLTNAVVLVVVLPFANGPFLIGREWGELAELVSSVCSFLALQRWTALFSIVMLAKVIGALWAVSLARLSLSFVHIGVSMAH